MGPDGTEKDDSGTSKDMEIFAGFMNRKIFRGGRAHLAVFLTAIAFEVLALILLVRFLVR